LKNCKFPGNLAEISHGPQAEDDRPLYDIAKGIWFLENVALKSLIQPTRIGSRDSTCKHLHRRSVPRYRSYAKTG